METGRRRRISLRLFQAEYGPTSVSNACASLSNQRRVWGPRRSGQGPSLRHLPLLSWPACPWFSAGVRFMLVTRASYQLPRVCLTRFTAGSSDCSGARELLAPPLLPSPLPLCPPKSLAVRTSLPCPCFPSLLSSWAPPCSTRASMGRTDATKLLPHLSYLQGLGPITSGWSTVLSAVAIVRVCRRLRPLAWLARLELLPSCLYCKGTVSPLPPYRCYKPRSSLVESIRTDRCSWTRGLGRIRPRHHCPTDRRKS